ncbi:hypothetical protein Ahy_B03g066831 isoform D [Arachis hypogaea]|uniref:Uncharacterized protein n=1 Tax=Arachis hypogaea TaxID=3818 RepID=A0A445A4Z2_ARAHY|nr:hypothetical protein Ahy_B03g066831 isoform D [Arachis hypogaea]
MYKKGNYCVQRECSVEIWHELGFSQVAKHHEAQSSDRETWQRRSSYAVTEMEGGGRAVAVVSQRLVGRGELKNQNPIHHCEKGGAALTSLQPMRRTQKSSVASNTGGVNHSSSNYGIGVAGYGGLNGPGSSPINSAPTCRPEGASMELPVSRRLSPTKIGRPEERQRRSLRQEVVVFANAGRERTFQWSSFETRSEGSSAQRRRLRKSSICSASKLLAADRVGRRKFEWRRCLTVLNSGDGTE